MNRSPQVRVTLSDDLLIHLRKTAQAQQVSIRWLVAGLVCDTLEARTEHHEKDDAQFALRTAITEFKRTQDQARKTWYAYYRQVRIARWFGFIQEGTNLDRVFLSTPSTGCPDLAGTCQFSEPQMNASC